MDKELLEDLKALPKDLGFLILEFADPRSDTCKIFTDFLQECRALDIIIRQFYLNETEWYLHRDVADLLLFEINLFKTLVQKRSTYRKASFLSRYYLARYFARGGLVPAHYEHGPSHIALRRYCAMFTSWGLYMPELEY